MLYLLDANVLIDANRDYYPIQRVPEFWQWLVYLGGQDLVKIPIEIYEEIKAGNDTDDLAIWSRVLEIEKALVLDEESDPQRVARIVDEGYGSDLTDDQLTILGRDPFLIAHALSDPSNRCIVTTEPSKPSKHGYNRRIPDVCQQFGITACNTYGFIKLLDFSTSWQETLK